jgi:hypothetical protein
MRKTEDFPRSKLSFADVMRILDAAAAKGVEAVSFTGGEPLLFLDEVVALMKTAGSLGIKYIRTGTNGFLFANGDRPGFDARVHKFAEKLAATPLRNLWISIDSVDPAVHEQMRGFPHLIRGIARALPIFHSYGLYPSANLGITRAIGGAKTQSLSKVSFFREESYLRAFYLEYKHGFREFYRFVADLGFTMVNTCYPMSIDGTEDLKAVYGATSVDPIVRFSQAEKALLYRSLLEIIPEFRARLRIFSPRCSLYALYRQYSAEPHHYYPCRGGIDFFFIDCKDGKAYPCGYRGDESLGRYWDLNSRATNRQTDCHQCDWECFRDPSELFGPILEGLSNPFRLFKRLMKDRYFFRLWIDDLRYYRACDLFDGRKPPNYNRIRNF